MKINEISRTCATSWCPVLSNSNYIAGASIAGVFDSNFSEEPKLEIFSAINFEKITGDNLIENEKNKDLIGSCNISDSVNCLNWGNPNNEKFNLGIIASGMADGNIDLYDPSKIVKMFKKEEINIANEIEKENDETKENFFKENEKKEDSDEKEDVQVGVNEEKEDDKEANNPLIANLQKHSNSVKSLKFNPKQKNLLASSGMDSTILVWNLQDPLKPSVISNDGKRYHEYGINEIEWNSSFPFILGTISSNGCLTIWDLKKKKPYPPFLSPKKRKYSSLQWNPEQPMEIAVSCDCDDSGVIEIWDLRKGFQPVRELVSGEKGILSISWCPDDSNLLISSDRNNKILIWNPNNGEILSEFFQENENSYAYSVEFSKKQAIVSTTSFEKIRIFSLVDSNNDLENNEFSEKILIKDEKSQQKKSLFKNPPKWLKIPCGVSFGFGNKIFSFNDKNRKIKINQLNFESDYIQKSKDLENFLIKKNLNEYFDKKILEKKNDQEEQFFWKLLKILVENSNKKEELLKFIGFDKEDISKKIKEELSKIENEKKINEELDKSENEKKIEGDLQDKQIFPKSEKEMDELIKKSVIISDFETAVSCCLKCGRLSDALILATCGGKDLWKKTCEEYFKIQKNPVIKIVSRIVSYQLDILVEESNLDDWKDTLFILFSFAKENFNSLGRKLGNKLENEKKDIKSAIICYLICGSLDNVLDIWLNSYKNKLIEMENASTLEKNNLLFELVEKIIVLHYAFAVNINKENKELIEIISEYAKILAFEGSLTQSLRYLNMVSNLNQSQEFLLLRYRVFNSLEIPFGDVPKFPFEVMNIGESKTQQIQNKSRMQNQVQVEKNQTSLKNQMNQFNQNQFNQNQFNQNQINSNQFDSKQFVSNQFNPNQFNPNQFNPNQFNQNQINPNQFDSKQFVSNQFNPNQFNPNQNQNQFNQNQNQNNQSPSKNLVQQKNLDFNTPNNKIIQNVNLENQNKLMKNVNNEILSPPPTTTAQSFFQPKEEVKSSMNSQSFFQPKEENVPQIYLEKNNSPNPNNNFITNVKNVPQEKEIKKEIKKEIVKEKEKEKEVDIDKMTSEKKEIMSILTKAFLEKYQKSDTPEKRIVQRGLESLAKFLKINDVVPELLEELKKFSKSLDEKNIEITKSSYIIISVNFSQFSSSFSKGLKFLTK